MGLAIILEGTRERTNRFKKLGWIFEDMGWSRMKVGRKVKLMASQAYEFWYWAGTFGTRL